MSNPTRVRLTNVRCTFPKYFTAEKFKATDKDAYYSGSWLLPKDHPDLPALAAAIKAAATVKWKEKADAMLAIAKANNKLPIHDGDLKAAKPYGAAYKGLLYVSARNNASTSIRPTVCDNVADPATGKARVIESVNDSRAPYSGCYVTVLLDLFGYEKDGGTGIGASIAGVQFLRDGERLAGGSVAAADDFEALPETAVKTVAAGGAADLF